MRFLLGDTALPKTEVQDETIQYFLDDVGLSELATAARCARSIANHYASLADVTVDDQLTRYSHVHKAWLAVADRLTAEAAAESVAPNPATAGSGYSSIIVRGIGDCRGPLDNDCYPRRWPC